MAANRSIVSHLVSACALSLSVVGTAAAIPMVGLTNTNRLVLFDSATPNIYSTLGVSGLQAGETLLAIDERPATGQVYAVSNQSRLYTIDPRTLAAVPVGTPFVIPLNGTSVGLDFNPTVDRIRLVTNAGQNMRLHPDTGAVVDADAVLAGTQPDGNLNGAATGADAAGYINNVATATTTTLFVIDSISNALYAQNPPNAGTLVAVGPLGVDPNAVMGFDVSSTGLGFAALQVGGISGLYSINTATGAATAVGTLGVNNVLGLTASGAFIVAPQLIPTTSTTTLLGLAGLLVAVGFAAFRRRLG